MQIHCLAKHGDLEGVRLRLQRGVEVDIREPSSGLTPLHHACRSQEAGIDLVHLLVDAGANIDAVSDVDQTPMRLATQSGDAAKLKALIGRGASIRPTPKGYTPLIDAISYHDRLDLVELLLNAGVDADAVSSYGESALSVASHAARFEAIRCLLGCGADPAPLGWDPLMQAIALDDPATAVRAIELHQGALANRDRWERTPLLLALHRGKLSIIEALAKLGADGRVERARCGHTALMHAVVVDRVEVVRWCLARGADPNSTNDFGETALMVAARYGSVGCVRALLDAGASLAAESQSGSIAITEAANAATLSVLVESGANINTVDGCGYGLLKKAAEHGDLTFSIALLNAGADTEATSTGDTALHMATGWDELAIMKVLLDHGAKVNALDVDGWTPLFMARSVEAVHLLIEYGADPTVEDLAGGVARDWIENGNEEAAQVLGDIG